MWQGLKGKRQSLNPERVRVTRLVPGPWEVTGVPGQLLWCSSGCQRYPHSRVPGSSPGRPTSHPTPSSCSWEKPESLHPHGRPGWSSWGLGLGVMAFGELHLSSSLSLSPFQMKETAVSQQNVFQKKALLGREKYTAVTQHMQVVGI